MPLGAADQSSLDGKTRVFAILGDPIEQVKSPTNVTASFRSRSYNGVLVPYHVQPKDFDKVVDSLACVQNFGGLVITVPHKFAASRRCAALTGRAAFLGAVNVMRRNARGEWIGDMCDGAGFVSALQQCAGDINGKTALLLGAGGAGSAIGFSLLEAGVRRLSVHDSDPERSDALVTRLSARFYDRVQKAPPFAGNHQIIANATPMGLGGPDEAPLPLDDLRQEMIVGDVITAPYETALVRAGRDKGCNVSTGHEMYNCLQELMVNFLLDDSADRKDSALGHATEHYTLPERM